MPEVLTVVLALVGGYWLCYEQYRRDFELGWKSGVDWACQQPEDGKLKERAKEFIRTATYWREPE